MARTPITAVDIPDLGSNGYDLTGSSDFATLATGTGNGVEFTYDQDTIILLKNTTGGNAVYTPVIRVPAGITAVGGSVTDPTVTVATAKTHIIRPSDVFKQSDGKMYIDCDVAGQLLVLNV